MGAKSFALAVLLLVSTILSPSPFVEAGIAGARGEITGDEVWIRQFGTRAQDGASGIAADGSGAYVVGFTYGAFPGQTSAGFADAFIRKYSLDGNEAWTRQFGTPSVDFADSVSTDASGVYVAGGAGQLPGQASGGGFVRRYDSNGNEAWTRQFPDFEGFGIAVAASRIYVAGSEFVRRYDPDGNEIWTRSFRASDFSRAFGVAVEDSGVYVAGFTFGTFPGHTSAGAADAFVRKYDPDGNEIWTRQFGTGGRDAVNGVVVDASGVYVAGDTDGALPSRSGAGSGRSFVRAYDSDGNERWTRQFGTSRDSASSLDIGDSGIHVVGFTFGAFPGESNVGSADAFVRMYDADGNEVWTRQVGSTDYDAATGVVAHASGIYSAGLTLGRMPGERKFGESDAFVVKYPAGLGPRIDWPGLSEFEKSLALEYDAESAFRLAEYLSTPNDGWAEAIGRVGKVSGSPAERAAAEFVAGKLREYGLEDVAIREYPTISWDPHDFGIRVVVPEDRPILAAGYAMCYGSEGTVDAYAYEALTIRGWGDRSRFTRLVSGDYSYSFATPGTNAIVGDLLWVGLGTVADYEQVGDVRGKVVLVLRNDLITSWPTFPLFEAANRGAAAVIFFGQHGENQHPDGVRGDVVCPGPIPVFQTSVNGAHVLQGLLASGPVTVSLRGRADIRSEAVAESVYVEGYIYGARWPDQVVLLNSQIDSWFYSATDGVSGLSTTLEIARLYAGLKAQGIRPARTLAFALVGSEEMGNTITTFYNWLGGSSAYVRQHPGIGERLVAALDLDVIGFPACCGLGILASWELQDLLAKTVRDMGLESRVWLSEGLTIGSDMWLYTAVAGGSGVYCCDLGGFGEVYHNQFDTFNRQSFDQYEVLGRFFAVLVHRLADRLVVPLDLEALFRWMEGGLWTIEQLIVWEAPLWQEYDDALAPAFEAVEEGIQALKEAWKRVVAEAAEVEAQYESARSARARRALEDSAHTVNQAILGARVHIVNWAVNSYELFRGLPYAGDFRAIQWAIYLLRLGDPRAAALALTEGWTDMWWGHLLSHETYIQIETWAATDQQWAGEHGQTPIVIDVKGEYDRLVRGDIAGVEESLIAKRSQLLDLLRNDLEMLRVHLETAKRLLAGG